LDKPVENLSPDEILARAGALARADAFRALAGQCAYLIRETLGYPQGSWGLSQKIFWENFDISEQIKWINDQLPAADRFCAAIRWGERTRPRSPLMLFARCSLMK
jgi:hypothetical protein